MTFVRYKQTKNALIAGVLLGLMSPGGEVNAAPITLDDMAGEYFFGDGTGVNCTLTLLAAGKFTFIWRGCLGTYDQNDGAAAVEDGELRLAPTKPNERKGFQGTPTKFQPVRWGERTYLVPPAEMADFCSAVNAASEPRKIAHGMFYLRRDDWTKPPDGSPGIPPQFTEFLLSKPVRGKVTQRIGKYSAWVNIGAKDGLRPGMILTASDTDKMLFARVRVEEVEPERCRIMSQWREKDGRLVIGEVVYSRFQN